MTVKQKEKTPCILPDFNLAKLQCFDAQAFVSDDKDEQEVCNFILMLALAHNDFKDIFWALRQINKIHPKKTRVTTYCGQIGGMYSHLMKLSIAHLCELANSIKNNIDVLNKPLFKKVLSYVKGENIEYWSSLVGFAQGESDTELKRILIRIRGNITFHYHPKEIASGYKSFMDDETINKDFRNPYISRGNNWLESRFYFADAAVQGSISKLKTDYKLDMLDDVKKIIDRMNIALYHIVERFCQIRGKGYISVDE